MEMNVIQKPKKNSKEKFAITSPEMVIKLKDVKEIRNAIREHLLFVGLDYDNYVRNISVLGIGTSNNVIIDTKEILRYALFSASDKVILIHNHPSNSPKPSNQDKYITSVTKHILDAFNIELLDHIIVTEKDYLSMKRSREFDNNYGADEIDKFEKELLYEENLRLKQQIKELQKEMVKHNSLKVVSAKCVGNYNDTTVYNVELSLNGEKEYATLERKYNDRDASHKWEVFSKLALKDEDMDYIIQVISKNPPLMSIDAPPIIYESLSVDEIEMEE